MTHSNNVGVSVKLCIKGNKILKEASFASFIRQIY